MAAAAGMAWAGVEVSQHVTAWSEAVTYWNILTRFYVYEAIVLLVAPMRDVVLRERDLAAREAEAADKLRALNEIRDSLPEEERTKLEQLEAMVELRRSNTQAQIAAVRFCTASTLGPCPGPAGWHTASARSASGAEAS